MKIQCLYDKLVPIAELKPYPNNPNTHSPEQIVRLAKILEYQGWRYPVKVSKQSGLITSGHGRVAAAEFNNWVEIPVNFQDYENSDQEYADVVADNAIATWSELAYATINEQLKELDGINFDVELLGLKEFVIEPADKNNSTEMPEL